MIPIKPIFKNKNLKGKYCLSPFVSIQIDTGGNVYLCSCFGWLPTSIGNLLEQSLDKILAGETATNIRQSVIDGTYYYCNDSKCVVIQQNQLNTVDTMPSSILPLINDASKFKYPTEIVLAGDETCNLSCPSCRRYVRKNPEQFIHKQERLGKILQENIFSIPTTDEITLTVSTSGELFASPLLSKFLSSIKKTDFPNLHLKIQTNGLLCPTKWSVLGDLDSNIKMLTVTIDSCRQPVYEKLRRGGKWKDILHALDFIQRKKTNLGFKLHLRMVAQLDNHNEIYDFYKFAKAQSADIVEYTRIINWETYSHQEFKQIDVFDATHPLYPAAQHELNRIQEFGDVILMGGLHFSNN